MQYNQLNAAFYLASQACSNDRAEILRLCIRVQVVGDEMLVQNSSHREDEASTSVPASQMSVV